MVINLDNYKIKGNEVKAPTDILFGCIGGGGGGKVWDLYDAFLETSGFNFAPQSYDNDNLILLDKVVIPT